MSICYVRVRPLDDRDETSDIPETPDMEQGSPLLFVSREECGHGDTMCKDCRRTWKHTHRVHPERGMFGITDPFAADQLI